MDRVIVSHKLMKDFMRLPRSTVRLSASRRHAGAYTGMDIVEESSLQFEVCAGQLSQSIGILAQPVLDEMIYTMSAKLKSAEKIGDSYSIAIFPLMIELVTSGIARAFVGPELCHDPEWLALATGYTLDVAKVTADLQAHYRIFHPIVAPFLKSYRRIRSRFSVARRLLMPLIEERTSSKDGSHTDMLQWLTDSAKGKDAEMDRLVRRMLFLNMAAIHTTAEVASIALMDLCAHPEYISVLRKEMLDATEDGSKVTHSTLNKLKKTDSFIKESHRLNPLGLMTFNRYLAVPVKLSDGITLPAKTYISMSHYPAQRDPEYYTAPLKFDGLRFFDLRQNEGDTEKQHFTAIGPNAFSWGVGKFACPGRFWASAHIKLLFMVLVKDFDVGFPGAQVDVPERVPEGEKLRTSFTQQFVLRRN